MEINQLSLLIEKLINKINVEESEYIRNSDLNRLSSTQIHYLDLIFHETHPTPSLLAQKLKVTRPSATGHIEKLERLGYVKKVQSDEDGRVQFLELTHEGRTTAALHDRFHEVFTEKIVSNLSVAEAETLVKILSKVLK